MASEHFVSVATMIDDLRNDDRDVRLVSMKSLLTITQTLGPERTRSELIPYITDFLDEDDEVLKAMASALGHMLNDVGGVHFAVALLTPLEMLCTLDEVSVRDEAISAFARIAKTIFTAEPKVPEQQSNVIAVVSRLATSDHPQSRCSACGLIGVPFKHASPGLKSELKAVFGKLCEDTEVMVRRAACVALGATMAAALEAQVTEFMVHYGKFCKDSNESVRLQAVAAAVALCPLVDEKGTAQIVATMKALSSDAGWRVKFMLADKLGALCNAWSAKDVSKAGLAIFNSLCNDNAPEIRAACVFNLPDVVAKLATDAAKRDAIVQACKLASDATPHVRNCLATALLKAAAHVGKDVWSSQVVPTCASLLQDADSQVRLAVVTSFGALTSSSSQASPPEDLRQVAQALIPVVVALSSDASWRVRETVVGQIAMVVQISQGAGAEDFVDVTVAALGDQVASVRAAAVLSCRGLLQAKGGAWGRTALLPKVVPLAQSKQYRPRAMLLEVVEKSIDVCEASFVKSDLMPIVVRGTADRVSNVRLMAARSVIAALQHKKMSKEDLATVLQQLRNDADIDVQDLSRNAPA
jgi:serine/threonine-protein phosphatase 2A regulatory subunit A